MVLILTNVQSIEVVFERNYGQLSTGCQANPIFYWQDQTNSQVMQDCDSTTWSLANSPYSQLSVMNVTSSVYGFNFQIPSSSLYSYVGFDVTFFSYQYDNIMMSLATSYGFSNYEVQFDSELSVYNSNNIHKSKSSLVIKQQFPTGSLVQVYNQDQILGIRSIVLWVNCVINCQVCSSATTCSQCIQGFEMSTFTDLSGTYSICDRINDSSYQCLLLNYDSDGEYCSKCRAGYSLDPTRRSCVTNPGYVGCAYYQYHNESGFCSDYSVNYFQMDSTRTNWIAGTLSQNSASTYKCRESTFVLFYNYQNYELFNCDCLVEKCNDKCTQLRFCDECEPGYYLTTDNQHCNACSIVHCSDCQSSLGVACDFCFDPYVINSISGLCAPVCDWDQYLDVQQNICIVCNDQYKYVNNGECFCYDLNMIPGDCNVCKPGYFFDSNNNICFPCSAENCSECLASLGASCDTCIDGYYLEINVCLLCDSGRVVNLNQCLCPNSNEEFDSTQNKCLINQTIPEITGELSETLIAKGFLLVLGFEVDLHLYVGQEIQEVLIIEISNIQDNQFTYEVTEIREKNITVSLTPLVSINNRFITLTLKDSTFNSLNNISTLTYSKLLKRFTYYSEEQRISFSVIASLNQASTIAIIVSIIPIILFSNFYILTNTIDLTAFLYFLLFIDVRYPENVLSFFEFFQNFQFPFIPSMFQSMISQDYVQEAPQRFLDNGFQPYFLSNSGQSITIVLFILGLYGVGKLFSYVSIPKVQPYLKRAMNETWEFGAFFDLLWSLYIYFLIGSILQFTVYDSGEELYILNYFLHTIFAIIHLGCPFVITYYIYKKKNMKSDTTFQTKCSSLVGGIVLFDENQTLVKEEQPQGDGTPKPTSESPSQIHDANKLTRRQKYQMKLTKMYNPILYHRKILFSFIIIFMVEFPYAQLTLISCLNVFVVSYILYISPLDNQTENIKNAIGEIVLIINQICVMFLVPDESEEEDDKRVAIGWIIISLSGMIMSWHTLQMLYEMIKSLFNAIKKLFQTKKNDTKVHAISEAEANQIQKESQSIRDLSPLISRGGVATSSLGIDHSRIIETTTKHFSSTQFDSSPMKLSPKNLTYRQQSSTKNLI